MRLIASIVVVIAGCAISEPDEAVPEDPEDMVEEPIINDEEEPEDVPSIGAPAPTTASCSFTSGDNVAKLRCYTCQKACDGSRPAYCSGEWPARAASCIAGSNFAGSAVYRWYEAGSDDPQSAQEYLRPFVLLGYLRLLRNTASSNPEHEPQLTAQIDYLLDRTHPFAAGSSGPASRAWQTYFRRGDGVVRRYADGLAQAGYAQFFATVARNYLAVPAKRDRYLGLALEFDNAMERPAGNKTGGVRVVSPVACGAPGLAGPCWYFHSRAPSNQFVPGTALNQSLFVSRVALQLLVDLSAPEFDTSWPQTIARDAWRERLRDRVAAALSQWAYGAGNTAATPNEPPNLRQHWMPTSIGTTSAYYWSFYQFDLALHVPENKASAKHVCNYHTVNLNNLAGILSWIDPSDPDGSGPQRPGAAVPLLGTGLRRDRLDSARAALLSYTKQGVPEPRGLAKARYPVYQWFLSEIDPAIREGLQGCTAAGADGLEGLYDTTKQYFCHRFGAHAATPNAALATLCP